jgi:DNA-directed RNA polymerase specialized sigma24 family protein
MTSRAEKELRQDGAKLVQLLKPVRSGEEVAKAFGVSRSTIRTMEERALGKIYRAMKEFKHDFAIN